MGGILERAVASAQADLEFLPRLVIALLLTGLLGWERERKDRPAGLRTHMLVGISACSFVILGEVFVERFASEEPTNLRFDPIRIVEATVAGVSFLGAGTIFVSRGQRVRGLTTAGSLLASAAVGMMVAVERYTLALVTTFLLFAVITWIKTVERRIGHRNTASE